MSMASLHWGLLVGGGGAPPGRAEVLWMGTVSPPSDYEFQLSPLPPPGPRSPCLPPPSICQLLDEGGSGHQLPLPAYGPSAVPSQGPRLCLLLFEARSTSIISLTGAVHSQALCPSLSHRQLERWESARLCALGGAGRGAASPVLPPMASRSPHLGQAMGGV